MLLLFDADRDSILDFDEIYREKYPEGGLGVSKEILDEDYSVKVGARATVGDVYSKGRVLLRSNTHVRGEIVLAGSSNVNDIYVQNGSTIDNGITNIPHATWDAHFLPQNYDLDSYSVSAKPNLIVRNGDEYRWKFYLASKDA